MELQTKRFGVINYREEEVFTFPEGLLGFEDHRRFLIRASRRTEPVRWLLSLTNGMELPITSPEGLVPEYRVGEEARALLGEGSIKTYCVLVLPRDLTKTTADLRAPILVNHTARTGMQYEGAELKHQPVARKVYRELFG